MSSMYKQMTISQALDYGETIKEQYRKYSNIESEVFVIQEKNLILRIFKKGTKKILHEQLFRN